MIGWWTNKMYLILIHATSKILKCPPNVMTEDKIFFNLMSQTFHTFQCGETRSWESFKATCPLRLSACGSQTSSISKIRKFLRNARSLRKSTSLTKRVQPRNLGFNKPPDDSGMCSNLRTTIPYQSFPVQINSIEFLVHLKRRKQNFWLKRDFSGEMWSLILNFKMMQEFL